jgi:hypothetical protein
LLLLSVFQQLPPKPCRLAIKRKTVWSFKSLADAASAFIAVLMADVAAMATMAAATGAPR